MKTSELAKLLGVSVKRIDQWCSEGMPAHGPKSKRKRQFNPSLVYQWLIANGHAVADAQTPAPEPDPPKPPAKNGKPPASSTEDTEPNSPVIPDDPPPITEPGDGLILRTRAECAKYFDVHVRTVATWLTDPTFPGKSGDKGAQNGYFPALKIFMWLQRQSRQRTVEANPTRQKLDEIKLAAAEHKLRQERGEVISLDDAIALVSRAQSIAINRLMALPDMLVELLPPDMDQRLKDDYYERASNECKQAAQSVGRALMEDDDE